MPKLVGEKDALQIGLSRQHDYKAAVEKIKEFSQGRIWLIGSRIYSTIIDELYGYPTERGDLDFIVEKLLPIDDERVKYNDYGNPRLSIAGAEVDIIPLNNINSIRRRGLYPTIENFLTGTPLTIQSLAYTLDHGPLLGEIGLRALRRHEVAVNDPIQAKIYADYKGYSRVEDLLKDKAKEIGFKPIT